MDRAIMTLQMVRICYLNFKWRESYPVANKQIIYKWSWDEDLRYHVQMDGFYVMEVHIIFVTAS